MELLEQLHWLTDGRSVKADGTLGNDGGNWFSSDRINQIDQKKGALSTMN